MNSGKVKEKQWRKKLQDFVVVIFKGEDRIISDIVYGFKTARQFNPNVVKELQAQTRFRVVLDVTQLSIL